MNSISTPQGKPLLHVGNRSLSSRISAFLEHAFPHAFIALLARFSVGLTFWISGQTKVDNFVIDPIGLTVQLGIPHLSDSAIELFRTDYALPVLPPEVAALMAATSEHLFSFLLIIGLFTRFSAFALLVMTLVIQIFVYPSAYPTHALWATAMLYLIARGPGWLSLDHLIHRRLSGHTHR